jgi:hypothetical protein
MAKKGALPVRRAAFIEPMECLPVEKLPTGANWSYEILCCVQHKISYVAFGVMWRCCFNAADKAQGLLRSAT